MSPAALVDRPEAGGPGATLTRRPAANDSELAVHDVFVARRDEQPGWECATCGARGSASSRTEAITAAYVHKRLTARRVPVPQL